MTLAWPCAKCVSFSRRRRILADQKFASTEASLSADAASDRRHWPNRRARCARRNLRAAGHGARSSVPERRPLFRLKRGDRAIAPRPTLARTPDGAHVQGSLNHPAGSVRARRSTVVIGERNGTEDAPVGASIALVRTPQKTRGDGYSDNRNRAREIFASADP